MAARRAMICVADLRRLARVSREEGVSIKGSVGMDGAFTITIHPTSPKLNDDGGDLDDRLAQFGAS